MKNEVSKEVSKNDIYKILENVFDPEIPVVSVVDLGIIRGVIFTDESLVIRITPTYSGCPAMKFIEQDILTELEKNGITAKVETSLSPAWTTDWLSEKGKKALFEYGIAPPSNKHNNGLVQINIPDDLDIVCPLCKSHDTVLLSEFGSTACKALYKCNSCLEPFDYFKIL